MGSLGRLMDDPLVSQKPLQSKIECGIEFSLVLREMYRQSLVKVAFGNFTPYVISR